jgi:hypothetical protein
MKFDIILDVLDASKLTAAPHSEEISVAETTAARDDARDFERHTPSPREMACSLAAMAWIKVIIETPFLPRQTLNIPVLLFPLRTWSPR